MWPSGKATGFGPVIRGFESLHPNQKFLAPHMRGYLYGYADLAIGLLFPICPIMMFGQLPGAVFALTFAVILNNFFDLLSNDQFLVGANHHHGRRTFFGNDAIYAIAATDFAVLF